MNTLPLVLNLIIAQGLMGAFDTLYHHELRAALPQQPSAAHLLGTTQAGQDVFSQLIYGTQTSLIVGVLAGAMAGLSPVRQTK